MARQRLFIKGAWEGGGGGEEGGAVLSDLS